MTVPPSALQKPITKLTSLTYDELLVGQCASVNRILTQTDVDLFAAVSGNMDPLHSPSGLQQAGNSRSVGHDMWAGALFSGLLGSRLPGPGTIYRAQHLSFHAPIPVGVSLTATITVRSKTIDADGNKLVTFDCLLSNPDGAILVKGSADVMPPQRRGDQPGRILPQFLSVAHDQLASLQAQCGALDPLPTAVIYPCDRIALESACEGARLGLIKPVLVGPQDVITAIARENDLDIGAFRLVDARHEKDAANKGVGLASSGEVGAVMKGALHTDELMTAVVRRDSGLRTYRRISHVFVMNVPSFHKPLLITDGVVNISPNADDKAHIIQNAVGLANVLGIETPKVAILSALETVNPKISSTVDAAVLCKMADRGQIRGAILDGPLAFDNAISKEAALTKGIKSEVAGDPDILLAPDLASANMLVKQLSFLAHADAAGIVLGAAVPVILTSRADNLSARLASCALAVLLTNK
ncbi:bifunctional enoyl-CoA hydratase/phosphate acetyltransferase [uncultured Cohaesibacter sp.]|uniref:bifunctional enoyl-CoA hydratase/phosphate acetyltransferase n=1 Tax=uncultured Cohaesibacter sp. TaxID=1002546 RepID=UPI0029C612C3|nr:bifunctional enoyl-CoA hydratase/phosphate acetyltransferase [uncultured Cohaesibacter sp.]